MDTANVTSLTKNPHSELLPHELGMNMIEELSESEEGESKIDASPQIGRHERNFDKYGINDDELLISEDGIGSDRGAQETYRQYEPLAVNGATVDRRVEEGQFLEPQERSTENLIDHYLKTGKIDELIDDEPAAPESQRHLTAAELEDSQKSIEELE